MTVEINGTESQNPTHAKRGVSATIYDSNGEEGAYEAEGRTQHTGGFNRDTPIVDVGAYLKDGENTIRIGYNSSITLYTAEPYWRRNAQRRGDHEAVRQHQR